MTDEKKDYIKVTYPENKKEVKFMLKTDFYTVSPSYWDSSGMKFDNDQKFFYGLIPETDIPSILKGTGLYIDEKYYEDPIVDSFINKTLSKFPLELHEDFEHDFALSFAGEDREIVEIIATELLINDAKVFYDFFSKADLLGKDLSDYFKKKYGRMSKYVVVFISKDYEQKEWTNFEFEIARDEAKLRKEEFILPVRLDDTIIQGLKRTIGFMDFRKERIKGTVKILLDKVNLNYRYTELDNVEKHDHLKSIENHYIKFQNPTSENAEFLTSKMKKEHITIEKMQKYLENLRKLFEKLYLTKAKTSYPFTIKILDSREMQEYFGIIARETTRPGVPIDDIPIYILDGKYYIIPNSATLRIENNRGQYDNLLTRNSPPELVNTVLNDFFKNIIDYIKNEHNISLKVN